MISYHAASSIRLNRDTGWPAYSYTVTDSIDTSYIHRRLLFVTCRRNLSEYKCSVARPTSKLLRGDSI